MSVTTNVETVPASMTVEFVMCRDTSEGVVPIETREPVRWEMPTLLGEALLALNALPDDNARRTAQYEVLRVPGAQTPLAALGFGYDHVFVVREGV